MGRRVRPDLPGLQPIPPTWDHTGAGDPNHLYENLGDGTFADISDRLPEIAWIGHTFIGAWHDVDHDGHLDLYIVNDFGARAAPTNACGATGPATSPSSRTPRA